MAMSLRFRYGTLSFLLMMTLIAVCFGWAADHIRLQRLVHQMTKYEEMLAKTSTRRQREFDYCVKVNRELRAEVAKLKGLPRPPGT
jgi:hypothetical protein